MVENETSRDVHRLFNRAQEMLNDDKMNEFKSIFKNITSEFHVMPDGGSGVVSLTSNRLKLANNVSIVTSISDDGTYVKEFRVSYCGPRRIWHIISRQQNLINYPGTLVECSINGPDTSNYERFKKFITDSYELHYLTPIDIINLISFNYFFTDM